MTQADFIPTVSVLFFADTGIGCQRIVNDAIHRFQHPPSRFDHVALVAAGTFYECAGGVGVRKVTDPSTVQALTVAAAGRKEFTARPDALAFAVAWAESQLGHAYSDLEFVADAVGLDVAQPSRWVCSSFAAAFLVRCEVLAVPDERAATPGSLALECNVT